jgi:hypothetical protein
MMNTEIKHLSDLNFEWLLDKPQKVFFTSQYGIINTPFCIRKGEINAIAFY